MKLWTAARRPRSAPAHCGRRTRSVTGQSRRWFSTRSTLAVSWPVWPGRMSALRTRPTRGERAATTSTARLTTAITSSHSPSTLVNIALVSFGSPDSRTTRIASATASLTPPLSSVTPGLMLKATIMRPTLPPAGFPPSIRGRIVGTVHTDPYGTKPQPGRDHHDDHRPRPAGAAAVPRRRGPRRRQVRHVERGVPRGRGPLAQLATGLAQGPLRRPGTARPPDPPRRAQRAARPRDPP